VVLKRSLEVKGKIFHPRTGGEKGPLPGGLRSPREGAVSWVEGETQKNWLRPWLKDFFW